MSSPQVASNDAPNRQSGESSSTLASFPIHKPLFQHEGTPPSSSGGVNGQPRNGTNGPISASPRANGSPSSKKDSIGRAGGFLLASTIRNGARSHRHRVGTVHASDSKEGTNSIEETPRRTNGSTNTSTPERFTQSLTSRTPNHAMQPDSTKLEMSSLPESDNFGTANLATTQNGALYDMGASRTGQQQTSLIDPSQIVSMALNLSEGRRRNMSGQSPAAITSSSPRVVSSVAPILPKSYHQGPGGSLKKHFQDQRRVTSPLAIDNSRNIPGTRLVSSGFGPHEADPSLQMRLSTATLARAEKARQYFELSGQYRRMLVKLPPLRHKRYSDMMTEHGQAHDVRELHQKGDMIHLGRDYNPLQMIRNRKARARARRTLDPNPEIWRNAPAVDDWLNVVENVAHGPNYTRGRSVNLPRYPPKQYEHLLASNHSSEDSQGSTSIKSSRPRLDWVISPSELLADAYWLEQDQNKTIIEDRQGSRVYSPVTTPHDPRISVDSRSSFADSVHASAVSEKANDSETESFHEIRGRRQNGHPDTVPNDGSGRLKQAWHKARRRSRSASSDLSVSEDDGVRKLRSKKNRSDLDYLNTGPLERHMSSMMDQQGLAPVPQSPGLTSLVTPNRWGSESRHTSNDTTSTYENGRLPEPDEKIHAPYNKQSSKSTTSFTPREQRRSMEHSSPGSPTINKTLIRSKTDIYSQNSRKTSPTRKKHYFHFSRSDQRKLDTGSALQDESDISSRRQSEDPKSGRQSLDNSRAARVHDLSQISRTNTNLSYLADSPTSKARDGRAKEGDSAVRRFFKGGISGLRRRDRNEQEGLDDDHFESDAETASMDESDTEDTSGTGGLTAKERSHGVYRRSDNFKSIKPNNEAIKSGGKRQYHIDLPTFRSSVHDAAPSRPTTPDPEKRSKQFTTLQSPFKDASSPMYNGRGDTPVHSHTSLAMVPSNISTLDSSEPLQPRSSRRALLSHFSSRSQQRNANQKPVSAPDHTRSDGPGLKDTKASPGLSALREIRSPSLTVPSLQRQHSADRNRHWSISNVDVRRASGAFQARAASSISHSDLMHVKALLICTGVKAAALARRSETDRVCANGKDGAIVLSMSSTAIAAKARQVTDDFDKESQILHSSAETFRNDTVSPLHDSLREMRIVVSECAEMARTAGDEAVGFGALITGQKTIEVRRILDQMERFRRKRRRRVRWIRRVGYGVLEWGVLFIMWQVWLVVVILRAIWSVFKGTFRIGRWALWL